MLHRFTHPKGVDYYYLIYCGYGNLASQVSFNINHRDGNISFNVRNLGIEPSQPVWKTGVIPIDQSRNAHPKRIELFKETFGEFLLPSRKCILIMPL